MKKTIILLLAGVLGLAMLTSCSTSETRKGNDMQVTVIQTSRGGDKLTNKGDIEFNVKAEPAGTKITIHPEQQFQKIIGFGGSFTESTAYVLSKLSSENRDKVIRAYFSPDGSNYSLTRTHMNGCDFSLDHYAYDNEPGDVELEHFSIDHDRQLLIPLIKDAMAESKDGFKIVSSPWTAPTWMKDNNDWNGGSLKPEYYAAWALYFSKYIKDYASAGIPIWAVTVENEPLGNDSQWDSMIYTPEQMADFVKNYLGPQFKRDEIDTRIMIFDQNRDEVLEWVEKILGDPEAAKYIWGTAVHWYSSTISWYPETLNQVHELYPEKHMMHTEGCVDADIPVWQDDAWYWGENATDWGFDWAPEKDKPLHPQYVPAFRYARDIIGGLNSWLEGWIDWNMVLDDKGGPNHAHNWAVAPVLVKPETDEVYFTPLYYVLAHFSKYIRPGAIRIGLDTGSDELMAVGCQNPDGSVVLVVLNPTENDIAYRVQLGDKGADITIPGHALQSCIIAGK